MFSSFSHVIRLIRFLFNSFDQFLDELGVGKRALQRLRGDVRSCFLSESSTSLVTLRLKACAFGSFERRIRE